MKKRILIIFTITATIFTLVGCNKKEILKIEDVHVNQSSNTYYTKDSNNNPHSSDDAILITSYNGYQCIGTNIEFDKETDKYTCTVEFKKITDSRGIYDK